MRIDDKGVSGLPLRTLYCTTPGLKLGLRSGHLVIRMPDCDKPQKYSLFATRQLVISEGVIITTPVIQACLDLDIPVTFIDRTGDLQGHLLPKRNAVPRLRIAQVQAYLDPQIRLETARKIVNAKIHNTQFVLRKFRKNYNFPELRETDRLLAAALQRTAQAQTAEELLGIEGAAARAWFGTFGLLIRPQEFHFPGRRRRPPTDPINSMLSLGYTLLTRECAALAEAWGMDSYIGFYHSVDERRPSLALDLIECLRTPAVDLLVTRIVNRRQIRPEHFQTPEGAEAVYLTREGRKLFYGLYENHLENLETEMVDLEDDWAPRDVVNQICQDLRNAFKNGTIRRWEPRRLGVPYPQSDKEQ